MAGSSTFFRWIMDGDNSVTLATLRDDAVFAARRLVEDNPDVGAIVCECTNLSPFAKDIHKAVERPVYDMVSMLHWFRLGLTPMYGFEKLQQEGLRIGEDLVT